MAKVLLVEDDNNLREIYEARLQAEGYDIASARDGEEALVIAKQVNPDLVISDVMMPKISGFEMLDILRNTEGMKHVKVIMLTALGQSEDQSRADSLGADRYLVKSQVTLEDIVNAAHDLLVDAGAIDAPAPAASTEAVAAVAAPIVSQPMAVAPAPEPTAPIAVTPTPEPVQPAVIPMAAPPQDDPVANNGAISMPPSDVSTIPTDELSGYQTPQPAEVPTPAVAIPEPAVAPEPFTVPAPPEAAPASQPVEVPTPAPVELPPAPLPESVETQTEQQESATVDAQIEEFVQHQSGMPEPEVQAPAAPVAVAPEVTTPETTTTTPEQEQALADALQSLGGAPQPEPSTDNPAPAPETVPASDDNSSRKNFIAPIVETSDTPKKSLDELVAADAAAEQAAQQVAPGATLAPAPPKPASQGDFDPNSIAL